MTDRRTLSSSLSASLVEYLRRRGHSQAKVARLLGVSDGFVSLVKSRERSLTLDHLERLSDRLDVPLGALLLAVSPPPKNPSPKTKRLYEISAEIVKLCDSLSEATGWGPGVAGRSS